MPQYFRNARTYWIYIALALCGGMLALPLRAQRQLADSMGFISNIQTGNELFHPHHILFAPIVYGFYHILKVLHLSDSAALAGQLHNTFWAIVGAAALLRLVRRISGSAAMGAAAALSLLTLAGYWSYATLVEPYVPATACALMLTALLAEWEDGPPIWHNRVAVFGFFTLMVAYQQPNVLWCVPFFVYVATLRRREALRDFGVIVAGAGILILAIYLGAYFFYYHAHAKQPFIPGFPRFCLSYAVKFNPDWGTFKHFGRGGAKDLLFNQTVNILQVERLAGHKALFAVLAGILALAVWGWNAVQIARGGSGWRVRLLSTVWLGVYYVFYLWWLPSEKEFFIITLAPLFILAFFAFEDAMGWTVSACPALSGIRRLAWLAFVPLVAVLGVYNYQHGIRINHIPPNDIYYQEAARLAKVAQLEDTVLTNFVSRGYLSCYFNLFKTLDIETAYQQAVKYGDTPSWLDLDKVPRYVVAIKSLHRGEGKDPARLKRYQAKLLGWQMDKAGKVVGCREFQAVKGEGNIYLRILPKRTAVVGEAEYFGKLDQAIGEAKEAAPAGTKRE